KQVNDLYQVRQTLEGMAIRLAVPRITEHDLQQIRDILADCQTALERDDMVAYSIADQQFHDAMARLSDNEVLIDSLGRLRRQIQLVRISANRDPQVVRRT